MNALGHSPPTGFGKLELPKYFLYLHKTLGQTPFYSSIFGEGIETKLILNMI